MDRNIKDLVAESRKPVIAHHSSWLGIDPQELNEESSFHAGTMKAAYDRLPGGLESTLDDSDYEEGEQMDAYLLTYEIPRGLINPTMHLDPHKDSNKVLRHSETSRKRLKQAPESLFPYHHPEQNKVIQYKNEFEDAGSTSYVIPSKLVNHNRIKQLSQQFITSVDLDEDRFPSKFKKPKVGFDDDNVKLKTFE